MATLMMEKLTTEGLHFAEYWQMLLQKGKKAQEERKSAKMREHKKKARRARFVHLQIEKAQMYKSIWVHDLEFLKHYESCSNFSTTLNHTYRRYFEKWYSSDAIFRYFMFFHDSWISLYLFLLSMNFFMLSMNLQSHPKNKNNNSNF